MARMYLVTDPVRHDGVDYAPGASIDLDAKAAARLLAVGAIAHDAQPPADVGATHASPPQPDTDPQPANAGADTDAPVGAMHASPPQADADTDAPVPDATPRAPVVPIGSKAAKASKAKPAE